MRHFKKEKEIRNGWVIFVFFIVVYISKSFRIEKKEKEQCLNLQFWYFIFFNYEFLFFFSSFLWRIENQGQNYQFFLIIRRRKNNTKIYKFYLLILRRYLWWYSRTNCTFPSRTAFIKSFPFPIIWNFSKILPSYIIHRISLHFCCKESILFLFKMSWKKKTKQNLIMINLNKRINRMSKIKQLFFCLYKLKTIQR